LKSPDIASFGFRCCLSLELRAAHEQRARQIAGRTAVIGPEIAAKQQRPCQAMSHCFASGILVPGAAFADLLGSGGE
jgi:hypothetical protein